MLRYLLEDSSHLPENSVVLTEDDMELVQKIQRDKLIFEFALEHLRLNMGYSEADNMVVLQESLKAGEVEFNRVMLESIYEQN
jgi:hypothetical protein